MIKMALNEYKGMKKRGQVSFFIIVGVLFLIIVGFAIYLTSLAAKERAEREVITTQQMPTEVQEINNYVVSCLGKLFDRGLVLLGQSGGRIYALDGGPTPNNFADVAGKNYILYDLDGDPKTPKKQIPYVIKKPIAPEGNPFNFNEPMYPWSNFPYNALNEIWFDHVIFGYSELPTLKKSDNPAQAPTSMEYQLQFYIKKSIPGECSDFSIFSAFDVEPDISSINSDVNITNDDITVRLHYPLTITNKANGEKRELTDFYIQPQIKFKDFYNIIYNFIDKETNNLRNKISPTPPSVPLPPGSVTIKLYAENVLNNDDLIKITATKLIKGQDYNFYFARKNRRPALLYIPDKSVDVGNTLIIDISNIGLDPPHPPNVFVNPPYELDELALDPDEDSLTYSSPDLLTGMSIESNTGKITWTPNTGQAGTYKITVYVTDEKDEELKDYQEITITVNPPP